MSDYSSNSPAPFPSFSNLPLTPENIRTAHKLIKPYIHRTPLLTCQTLNTIASTPRYPGGANPKINLYFKCENYQKIGAFKARGAHHAVIRLIEKMGIEEVRRRGLVTHSSGNHAQAIALAAQTFNVPAYIVMPSISTPSKIAATKALTRNVVFSGSTAEERERKVEEVIKETEAILVPPYDHADVIMGQGTVGREMEGQFAARRGDERCAVYMGEGAGDVEAGDEMEFKRPDKQFGAIIAPCGGGGLLSGIATYFSSPGSSSDSDCSTSSTSSSAQHHHEAAGTMKKTPLIFGAEPSFEDADDARRSLARHPPSRIESVKSLTIADGLRTPLGKLNWDVIRQKAKVEGVYAVGEEEIKESVRLMMERAKWVVEPSAAVPLAVILFNEEFRAMVENRQREEREREGQVTAWEVGVVVSGGNTTVEAIVALFGPQDKAEGGDEGEDGDVETEVKREREKGTIAMDGDRIAENVAG